MFNERETKILQGGLKATMAAYDEAVDLAELLYEAKQVLTCRDTALYSEISETLLKYGYIDERGEWID